jgi:hypothetical protein
MTAFNNIKTNNWPAASNDLEDFLVLKLPLNDQASLTESLPVTAGSKVLYPKRTLTNTGVSMVGSGEVWSNYVTVSEGNTGSNYNTDATNAFDGDTSTITSLFSGNMVSPYSPTTVVFTPPSAITVSTGVRVYMGVDRGQKILVNGTQTNASVSAGWNYVSFTGSLASLTIGPTTLGSSSNIAAIEIDGQILVDASPKKHYDDNAVFNSSTSLRLDSEPFSYGNNDFTMEFWCLLTGAHDTARHILSAWQDGGNLAFYLGTGGANGYWGSFGVRIGGSQFEANGTSSTGLIPQNTWTHVAGVRHGTNILLFVDGTLVNTTSVGSGTLDSLPDYLYVGKHYSASGYNWIGNLSDLRIYNGVAKYTANFTPPGAILG